MNIFPTSDCPILSAQALDDSRVNKMIIESMQMMAYALHRNGCPPEELPHTIADKPYKVGGSHSKHPCSIWAGNTKGNYEWLWGHTFALILEKRVRYPNGKSTVPYTRALFQCHSAMKYIPDGPQKEFANCSLHETSDQIFNYRMTMIHKWEKAYKAQSQVKLFNGLLTSIGFVDEKHGSIQIPKWTNSNPPSWYGFLRSRCAWQRVKITVKK